MWKPPSGAWSERVQDRCPIKTRVAESARTQGRRQIRQTPTQVILCEPAVCHRAIGSRCLIAADSPSSELIDEGTSGRKQCYTQSGIVQCLFCGCHIVPCGANSEAHRSLKCHMPPANCWKSQIVAHRPLCEVAQRQQNCFSSFRCVTQQGRI
jgi:hypothetical protein